MNSESEATITKFLLLMQELTAGMKILVANQEKLAAEQQRAAKAIGEIGILLKAQGGAIIRLWHEAGLPIDDESAPTPPMTN